MKQKRKVTKNNEKRVTEFLEQAKRELKHLRVSDLEISDYEFTNELINPQKIN